MIALLPTNIRLALRSLNRNRLRTLLTMLGIIIGVAAVLTMVGLGGGARTAVQDNVKSAGTNLVLASQPVSAPRPHYPPQTHRLFVTT
jgi:putative ABC transport system permease protein